MKLIHNIAVRLSMALLPVIALWAMVFYFVIVNLTHFCIINYQV